MRDEITNFVNTILTNSKMTPEEGSDLYLIHLSDLLESIGMLDCITSDKASPRSIKATIVGILNELYETSFIEYIDPATNDTVRMNMLIFCKAITAVDTVQIYIYDREVVENNIAPELLASTFNKIITGKLNIINTPTIIHYSSGTTSDTENIDGNATIKEYLDIFYSFGTKYGIAVSGKSATEYTVCSIYDIPHNLPFNDRIATMINYIDSHYLPDTDEKVEAFYDTMYNGDRSEVYPYDDIPKYMLNTFVKYVKTAIAAKLTDAVAQASAKVSEDLSNLMSDLTDKDKLLSALGRDKPSNAGNIDLDKIEMKMESNDDLSCGNSTTLPSNTTIDKPVISRDELVSSIGNTLGDMGIHIEHLTINTINIYTK